MNKKFVVYRRDIVSNTSYPIDKLLCFKIVENKLVYDKDKRLNGKSFYIKNDKESLNKFIKEKKFKRFQNLENTIEIISKLLK